MGANRPTTVFCPVCATGRHLEEKKFPIARYAALSVVWAVLFGALGGLLWGELSGLWWALSTGLAAFLFYEMKFSLRKRSDLVCPVCHFDPILYRRAPEKAKQRCLDSLKLREDVFLAKWQALKDTATT